MFATRRAASIIGSMVLEFASLVWMELSLLVIAGSLYILFMGVPWPSKESKKEWAIDGAGSKGIKQRISSTDHAGVLRNWESMKISGTTPTIEMASVVHSLTQLGHSPQEVTHELKSALQDNPCLLTGIASLPYSLIRDDAMELLEETVAMLEFLGHSVDVSVYAGLMTAQLRHRNYEGVATTGTKVQSYALTPKMRATLVAAAAHRDRLGESLGHLRHLPVPLEGARCWLLSSTVLQILTLAAREQQVSAATHELSRVRARVELKQLEAVINTEGRKLGASVIRELLYVGQVMGLPHSVVGYRALAVAASEDRAELLRLTEELEAELEKGPLGFSVGESVALSLIGACRSVGDPSIVLRIVELYRSACAGAPGGRVMFAACNSLVTQDEEAACSFCEHELLPRFWPDAALSGLLTQAAVNCGNSALVERLSMPPSRPPTGISAANVEVTRLSTIIQGYTRDRDLKGAIEVFDKLRSSGSALNPLICNCLLEAYVQCGDVEGGLAHFNEMKRLDQVDVVGFNTALKLHLTTGSGKAEGLLKEMAARGLHANKVTYNELLHAKVIAKDTVGLWKVLEQMTSSGIKPNSVTCSILLKSLTIHTHGRDVVRVMDLIGELEEIDEVLFSSVIEACTRIRYLDPLSDIRRQKRSPTNLTAPTYGSMIKAYGQAGDVVRVQELWQEMFKNGVKPTSITFGCMAEALVSNGRDEEAWDLVRKHLDSDEQRGCINTVIYSTVLKGFAVSRRIHKVFEAYADMRSKNIPCNTITYNTMLDACAKCSAMDRASGLLEDMQQARVEPDIITYSTLIKGYCLEGDVDRAFSMLHEMKSDEKFAPDEIMYNSILDGCAKQHRVDEALSVLAEMKAAGIGPSNYTLSILVKLLGHARRLNQAFHMVEELSSQNGFQLNVQVYTCLVQASVMNRRLERAMQLHDTMVTKGCASDEKFYSVLTRGSIQMHQPLKAVEAVRAAYQLPGGSLKLPIGTKPVGVESRVLDELVAKLQSGREEEQSAVSDLARDLWNYRGIDLDNLPSGRDPPRRRGNGHARR